MFRKFGPRGRFPGGFGFRRGPGFVGGILGGILGGAAEEIGANLADEAMGQEVSGASQPPAPATPVIVNVNVPSVAASNVLTGPLPAAANVANNS